MASKPLSVRRQKAETGLLAWVVAYATKNEPLTLPISTFHKQLCGELDRAIKPRMHFYGAFPREHAKTTIGTKLLTAYCAAAGKKKYILIVGATQREAEEKLSDIVSVFSWPEVIADYGVDILPKVDERSSRDTKNNSAAILLENGCLIVAIEAMAKVRGKITKGRRPDFVILDDPEDDENVRNPEWRNRFVQTFMYKKVINTIDSDLGSIVWLGTLLHIESPLTQFLRPSDPAKLANRYIRRLEYNSYDPETLVGPDNETPDPKGKPKVLWPQRWSFEKLMEKQDMIGVANFNSEFMNNPRDPSKQIFTTDKWRYYDRNLLVSMGGRWGVREQRGAEPIAFQRIALGVDPAFTAGKGDYTALTVWGSLPGPLPQYYILAVGRKQVNVAGIINLMEDFINVWGPDTVGVEMIAMQNSILREPLMRLSARITPVRSSQTKATRIEAMSTPFQQGHILVPDPRDYKAISDFIQEAANFPPARRGENDDMLDSAAQGLMLLKGVRRPGGYAGRHTLALAGQAGGY